MQYPKNTRIIIASCIALSLWFGFGIRAFAAITIVDPVRVDQYRGSFLAEKYGGTNYFWYVDPVSGDRYAVNTANDFSRLLVHEGQSITRKKLLELPAADNSRHKVSYDSVQKFKGVIMLQRDADDKAWYLNPLDLKMYYLQNGKDGFAVARELALDMSSEKLDQIPVTKDLGYTSAHEGILPGTAGIVDTSLYGDVFNTLESDHLYKDTFTTQDLFYGSLKGMAQATGDTYTEFYSPVKNQKEHDYFTGDTSIEGIGAAIDAREGGIYISWLVKGAPAIKAGLKAKDKIVSIDGFSAIGISVDAAVSRIKGPAGTSVKLTIYRASDTTTTEYTITRARIEVPEVDGDLISNNIAYFKFTLFTRDLIPQFQKLVNTLVTPSIQGIVIDMRDNIGGVTQSSAELADYWLSEKDPIFTERRPVHATNYVASGTGGLPKVPTVILVNGETASASEIFTAALKYSHKATVVGTKTFGKGTGQNVYDFADGSGLKMTTFEWLPPDGKSINHIGIMPDIIVEASTDGDAQLDRAVQVIRNGH